MGIGLNTESGSGDYADIVKYDARAGRFFRVDREQDGAGQWQTENVEITDVFQAIFDFDNIEVGWALFAAGVAPSFSMVKLGEPLGPRPSDQHKQTFRMSIKLGKSCGGDVREFASQAKVVIGAIDALHTEFETGRKANPNKLPVVALEGSTPVTTSGKGQSSTNYMPVFKIVGWVPRPPELGGAGGAHPPTDPLPKTEPAKAKQKATADLANEF